MRIGVAGCGLIGCRRAEVASRSGEDEVLLVADVARERAEAAGQRFGCGWTSDWRRLLERPEIEAVVVATTNDWLAPIAVASLEAGKHVLCEKPPGRSAAEAEAMLRAAQNSGRTLKIGFNHRHHPAIERAHRLCAAGAIGEPYWVRCRYGHGGRPGYEREWRFRREVSGGGELLDQGIHAIDLARWFLGEFRQALGLTARWHWPPAEGDGVEDNAFALLRSEGGRVASIHVSWTEWKNAFHFEVCGREGYLAVEGLGGSYGPETLRWGRRRSEGGPPEEQRFEFPGPDVSWELEWREFKAAIKERRQPLGSGRDGLEAMKLVEQIYRSAAEAARAAAAGGR